MFEFFSVGGSNSSSMNISRELFDALVRFLDVGAQLRVRRECGVTQPVMADHALLIRICDRTGFQVAHCGKGFFNPRPHLVEKIIPKLHSTDVDREIEIVVTQEVLLKTLPERGRSHHLKIMEGRPPCRPTN